MSDTFFGGAVENFTHRENLATDRIACALGKPVAKWADEHVIRAQINFWLTALNELRDKRGVVPAFLTEPTTQIVHLHRHPGEGIFQRTDTPEEAERRAG